MNLYEKKKKHDEKINIEEIKLSNEINDMIDNLLSNIEEIKEYIEALKSFNIYEVTKKDLPKFKELNMLIETQIKLSDSIKLVNELTKKIYELYGLIEKELT